MAITVHEITMFAKNIIRVELREPDITTRGAITEDTTSFPAYVVAEAVNENPLRVRVPGHTFSAGKIIRFAGCEGMTELNRMMEVVSVSGDWLTLKLNGLANVNATRFGTYVPNSGKVALSYNASGPTNKWVLGANLDHVRATDIWNDERLNRANVRTVAQYGVTGKTVTAIGYECEPYTHGGENSGVFAPQYPFRHWIFITCNTDLSNGTYTISFPASMGVADQTFVFNDKVTRACTILASQIGFKPDDPIKRASLSGWLPQGTNWGEFQFSGIADWHIIDSLGATAWSAGAGPALRHSPSDADYTWNKDRIAEDPLIAGVAIQSITLGNPTIINAVGHGKVNGDVVTFKNVLGPIGLNFGDGKYSETEWFTVTRITDGQFSVPYNSTGKPAHTANTGKVLASKLVNTHGTYVYTLDFSALNAASLTGKIGPYRIYVPGLGVSDPFRLDNEVWWYLAQTGFAGIFNQRSGCALDGEFGFTRPVAYRPGVNGFKIYNSKMPEFLWTDGGISGSPVGAPWHTNDLNTDAWGGHFDAADYDQYTAHIAGMGVLLYLWELSHPSNRNTYFGTKQARYTIGGIYTRRYPDIIEEAIWSADWLRRCQDVNGGVPSYKGFDLSLTETQAGVRPHTSYLDSTTWFVERPTSLGQTAYACIAAKLAWCFDQLGYTTERDVWQASAIAAYNRAREFYYSATPEDYFTDVKDCWYETPATVVSLNPLTFSQGRLGDFYLPNNCQVIAADFLGMTELNGNTYTLRQSGSNFIVYNSTNTAAIDATAFGAYTVDTGKFRVSDSYFQNFIRNDVHGPSGLVAQRVPITSYMQWTAGCLLRLTKDTTYKTHFDTLVSPGSAGDTYRYSRAWGSWDYYWATAEDGVTYLGNPTYRTNIKATYGGSANSNIVVPNSGNNRGFSQFSAQGTSQGQWGSGLYPGGSSMVDMADLLFGHRFAYLDRIAAGDTHAQARANAGVVKFEKAMIDGMGFLLGQNPTGKCMGHGIGVRNIEISFHRDHWLMGVPAPRGVFLYATPPFTGQPNPPRVWTSTYYWPVAPCYETNDGSDTTRELVPFRASTPLYRRQIETDTSVIKDEWTFHQCSLPVCGVAMYLHAWGEPTTQPAIANPSFAIAATCI